MSLEAIGKVGTYGGQLSLNSENDMKVTPDISKLILQLLSNP